MRGGIARSERAATLAIALICLTALCAQHERLIARQRTVAHAEALAADFRSNDRDGGLVNDFWTAEILAFYGVCPFESAADELFYRALALTELRTWYINWRRNS